MLNSRILASHRRVHLTVAHSWLIAAFRAWTALEWARSRSISSIRRIEQSTISIGSKRENPAHIRRRSVCKLSWPTNVIPAKVSSSIWHQRTNPSNVSSLFPRTLWWLADRYLQCHCIAMQRRMWFTTSAYVDLRYGKEFVRSDEEAKIHLIQY